jgi:hypothetical protein
VIPVTLGLQHAHNDSNASPVSDVQARDPLYRRTFVGRERELRLLQAALGDAMARRRRAGDGGHGEPGIGKSALCEQFIAYAAERPPTSVTSSPNSAALYSVPPSRLSGGARTRTRLREGVRDAAIVFTDRGLYPSASHIADLLGDRNVMRSHTAQAAWREVLSELGWSDDRAAS